MGLRLYFHDRYAVEMQREVEVKTKEYFSDIFKV